MTTTWRNVNEFQDAPEIKHDGHAVEILRPLTLAESEVEGMCYVRCLVDGEAFQSYPEELRREARCDACDETFNPD